MPIKIKIILTLLVFLITFAISYKHLINNENIKGFLLLVICLVMIFGLWILPEATGKFKENNEKK